MTNILAWQGVSRVVKVDILLSWNSISRNVFWRNTTNAGRSMYMDVNPIFPAGQITTKLRFWFLKCEGKMRMGISTFSHLKTLAEMDEAESFISLVCSGYCDFSEWVMKTQDMVQGSSFTSAAFCPHHSLFPHEWPVSPLPPGSYNTSESFLYSII